MFAWLTQMPFDLSLPAWQPVTLFTSPILFRANGISWVLAMSITALTFSILLTTVTQQVYVNSLAWAGTLTLGGLGILAVSAHNPLTLLLVWAALDLAELITQLSSVKGADNNERVVIAFSTRALGIGFLLWANILAAAGGSTFDFQSMPANVGIFLVIAAGLRLGVYPLHLPYSADSALRRGFGTGLRLVGAVASLSVLGHVQIPPTNLTPVLMFFAIVAAIYGGWMWLRAPDDLNGRPFWMVGMASLALLAALSGNPLGAAAWSSALILVGGALFLASTQNRWISRAMLIGAWSLSTLPFSLTASAWLGRLGFFLPLVIIAQALVVAGVGCSALPLGGVPPPCLATQRARNPRLATQLDAPCQPRRDRLVASLSTFIGMDRLGRCAASRRVAASPHRFAPDRRLGLGFEAFPPLQPCPRPLGHRSRDAYQRHL